LSQYRSINHGEKCFDLDATLAARMPHGTPSPLPADEKTQSVQVCLFGLEAIVQALDALPSLVEKVD